MSCPAVPVVVVSTAPPAVEWRCPRCDVRRTFRCSERFRINSSAKLVDIWLIYRCERCDATKNVTVIERTPVARVSPGLFSAATDNDPVVARRVARDVGLLRRAGARVTDGDEWVLDGPIPAPAVALEFPEPLLVRLEHVIAAALGVPTRDASAFVAGTGEARLDRLRLWGGRHSVRRAKLLDGAG